MNHFLYLCVLLLSLCPGETIYQILINRIQKKGTIEHGTIFHILFITIVGFWINAILFCLLYSIQNFEFKIVIVFDILTLILNLVIYKKTKYYVEFRKSLSNKIQNYKSQSKWSRINQLITYIISFYIISNVLYIIISQKSDYLLIDTFSLMIPVLEVITFHKSLAIDWYMQSHLLDFTNSKFIDFFFLNFIFVEPTEWDFIFRYYVRIIQLLLFLFIIFEFVKKTKNFSACLSFWLFLGSYILPEWMYYSNSFVFAFIFDLFAILMIFYGKIEFEIMGIILFLLNTFLSFSCTVFFGIPLSILYFVNLIIQIRTSTNQTSFQINFYIIKCYRIIKSYISRKKLYIKILLGAGILLISILLFIKLRIVKQFESYYSLTESEFNAVNDGSARFQPQSLWALQDNSVVSYVYIIVLVALIAPILYYYSRKSVQKLLKNKIIQTQLENTILFFFITLVLFWIIIENLDIWMKILPLPYDYWRYLIYMHVSVVILFPISIGLIFIKVVDIFSIILLNFHTRNQKSEYINEIMRSKKELNSYLLQGIILVSFFTPILILGMNQQEITKNSLISSNWLGTGYMGPHPTQNIATFKWIKQNYPDMSMIFTDRNEFNWYSIVGAYLYSFLIVNMTTNLNMFQNTENGLISYSNFLGYIKNGNFTYAWNTITPVILGNQTTENKTKLIIMQTFYYPKLVQTMENDLDHFKLVYQSGIYSTYVGLFNLKVFELKY